MCGEMNNYTLMIKEKDIVIKIPMWQKSMNIRQYDKGNDGLHASNPYRASLDMQVRGYNMSNIIKGSEFYENYHYEHI